jgi:anaerobic magnesium-protoporphyrin IX monomethyl ester cyclase
MRVLVTWPPHVPSYFNAGHHLPVFTIAAYLRAHSHTVDTLDAGALNCSWKEFGERVFRGDYDVVVLFNDFDVVEGVRRAADYCRALAPGAALVTVGRLSHQNPGFFQRLALDGVVTGGDYESGVAAFLAWVQAERPPVGPAGVAVRGPAGWLAPTGPAERLDPDEWVLPDVTEIPYSFYEDLYRDDQRRFCGIPDRRELVVPVARGCPVNCDFCDVPAMQGLRERRLPVPRVISYIRDCFAEHPFEYVAFYAPTFTLDRRWVRELCGELARQPRAYPWKCATTLHHLDEELVATMGAAGCVRISVGVETFEPEGSRLLPRAKRKPREDFERVLGWCTASGIELNCFVIVGLPGTTAHGARATIESIVDAGARARATLYTPYHRMRADMSEQQLSGFNRQTFVDPAETLPENADPADYHALIFADDGYRTQANRRIAPAAAAAPTPAAVHRTAEPARSPVEV